MDIAVGSGDSIKAGYKRCDIADEEPNEGTAHRQECVCYAAHAVHNNAPTLIIAGTYVRRAPRVEPVRALAARRCQATR